MLLLFYAGKLAGEYSKWSYLRFDLTHSDTAIGQEMYHGGYVYSNQDPATTQSRWWRCDGTPMLDEDVPLELKMQVLLMGDL